MKNIWIRIISVLEIIGGVFGLAFMGFVVLTNPNPIGIFSLSLAILSVGIYVLSFAAGVALWRGLAFGRKTSIIVQALQLPKIFSPAVIFMFSFGFDVWINYLQSGESFNLGFQLRFLAFNQLFFNMQDAPTGFGVSIVSCIFLPMLLRYEPPTIVKDVLPPPPPPVEFGDHAAAADSSFNPTL